MSWNMLGSIWHCMYCCLWHHIRHIDLWKFCESYTSTYSEHLLHRRNVLETKDSFFYNVQKPKVPRGKSNFLYIESASNKMLNNFGLYGLDKLWTFQYIQTLHFKAIKNQMMKEVIVNKGKVNVNGNYGIQTKTLYT